MSEFLESDRIGRLDMAVELRAGNDAHLHQDRQMAVADLLEESYFRPEKAKSAGVEGPYALTLSRVESRLLFDMKTLGGESAGQVLLSLTPFRKSIKEYQEIIASYFRALRENPAKIEAIDMARRGLHNQVAELLIERLEGKIGLDFDTARRLITLILVLESNYSSGATPVSSPSSGPSSSMVDQVTMVGQVNGQIPANSPFKGAVLFVCTRNAIRSAMAEAMLKQLLDDRSKDKRDARLYVDSAGLDPMDVDGFAVSVLKEVGVALERHESKDLDDLNFQDFDFIITLSQAATKRCQGMVVGTQIKHLDWQVAEPSLDSYDRERSLASYRDVRDQIKGLLEEHLEMLTAA